MIALRRPATVARWRRRESQRCGTGGSQEETSDYYAVMGSDTQSMEGAADAAATKQQVLRLLNEYPEELHLLRAACEQSRKCEPGDFAGSWVLREMEAQTGERAWRPGLRRLSASGVIVKTGTARGGRRAYYRMPDRAGVEQALAQFQARSSPRSSLTEGELP